MIRKKQTVQHSLIFFSFWFIRIKSMQCGRKLIAFLSLFPLYNVYVCSSSYSVPKKQNREPKKQTNKWIKPKKSGHRSANQYVNWQCSIKLNPMMWKVVYYIIYTYRHEEKNVALTFINGTFAKCVRERDRKKCRFEQNNNSSSKKWNDNTKKHRKPNEKKMDQYELFKMNIFLYSYNFNYHFNHMCQIITEWNKKLYPFKKCVWEEEVEKNTVSHIAFIHMCVQSE